MKSSNQPCNVCGQTDLKLLDGFYYCVECGTQDENVQETVVEHLVQGDGTMAIGTVRKILSNDKDGVDMGSEWNKWHGYNFVLAGLADELIAIGAKPSVKIKILWIWIRYIKKYQIKKSDEKNEFMVKQDSENTKSDSDDNENDKTQNDGNSSNEECSDEDESDDEHYRTTTRKAPLQKITKGLILALIYAALNLDESEFQLSHLQRFVREEHLSLIKCEKFLPKDLNVKKIPRWNIFTHSMSISYSSYKIRTTAFSLMLTLDLGLPKVPDFRKLVCNYTKELCLTNDFKELVLALMYQYPFDFVKVSKKFWKVVLIPDYESICMAYVLVVLKMCFGLDADYEIRLSELAEKVNNSHNYPKSYKFGGYTETSERWFNFREWCIFLQFRKTILCKHNFTLAKHLNCTVDEHVLLEHIIPKDESNTNLRYELTKDILSKIPLNNNAFVIPKTEFQMTLTPMTTYTDVILEYLQDPDLKLLLSEDYSQYSLEYVTNKSKLLDNSESKSLISGVDNSNKFIKNVIVGNFSIKRGEDGAMVYIRFCENRNWLDTKQPTLQHIKVANEDNIRSCQEENTSKSLIDHSSDINDSKITIFDSKSDTDSVCTLLLESEIKKEKLDEEQNERVITFVDYPNAAIYEDDTKDHLREITLNHSDNIDHNEFGDNNSNVDNEINDTFDRETVIKELLEIACQKYKISLPVEKTRSVRRERKRKLSGDEVVNGPSRLKRQRKRPNDTVNETVAGLLSIYYHKQHDLFFNPSDKACNSINLSNPFNNTQINIDNNSIASTSNIMDKEVSDINRNSIDSIDVQKEGDVIKHIDDHVSINDKTLLLTSSDTDTDDELDTVKTDPNFDKETHDVTQLYLDFDTNRTATEDITLNTLLDIDDELNCVLERHLERNSRKPTKTSKFSSDMLNRCLEKNKNMSHIKEFKYWLRHYDINSFLIKSREQHEDFNVELDEYYPKSFVFVLRECAVVADTSPFRLYKLLQYLEARMVKFLNFDECSEYDQSDF